MKINETSFESVYSYHINADDYSYPDRKNSIVNGEFYSAEDAYTEIDSFKSTFEKEDFTPLPAPIELINNTKEALQP